MQSPPQSPVERELSGPITGPISALWHKFLIHCTDGKLEEHQIRNMKLLFYQASWAMYDTVMVNLTQGPPGTMITLDDLVRSEYSEFIRAFPGLAVAPTLN